MRSLINKLQSWRTRYNYKKWFKLNLLNLADSKQVLVFAKNRWKG